jgi:hypothetical protein
MSEILLRCICEPLCKCLFDKFEVQHSSTAAVRRSVYVPKDMYPNTVRIKISNDKQICFTKDDHLDMPIKFNEKQFGGLMTVDTWPLFRNTLNKPLENSRKIGKYIFLIGVKGIKFLMCFVFASMISGAIYIYAIDNDFPFWIFMAPVCAALLIYTFTVLRLIEKQKYNLKLDIAEKCELASSKSEHFHFEVVQISDTAYLYIHKGKPNEVAMAEEVSTNNVTTGEDGIAIAIQIDMDREDGVLPPDA